MRIKLISALSAGFLMAVVALSQAQTQPPQRAAAAPPAASSAGPRGVAVIDITFILDNYPRLKQESDQFKADVENMGKQFKGEQETIVKSAEKLKTFKAGSPDFKKLEEELAQRSSDLKVKASLQEKEFAERESRMYLKAYKEVTSVVKTYAERNGISLVLRFNGAPVDVNNRDAIRAELFKTVMYNDPSIDITDQVLAELKRQTPLPTATRPQQPPPRTR